MATRHNLNINPAAKNNITNWQQSGANAPTRVTGLSGASSGRTTGAKWTTGTYQTTAFGAASPGVQYTVSADILTDTFNQSGRTIYINWSRSSGGDTQTSVSTFSLSFGVWSRISATATAPALTTGVGMLVDGINASLSAVTITAVLAEAVGTADTYFDGDTAGATWDGTDGNSASTLTSGGSVSADAALTATATLSTAGSRAIAPAAALTATATLTAAANKAIAPAAALTVTATLAAADIRAIAPAAALTATATLTAAATQASTPAAALVAVATLSTAGASAIPSAAALVATATLSTGATTAASLSAASALTVTATLSTAGASAIPSAAALTVTATLSTAGASAIPSAAALVATATLSTAPVLAITDTSALAAVATLAATVDKMGAPEVTAALVVTATFGAGAGHTIFPGAGLTATATLTATAVTGAPPKDADVDFAVTATLAAGAFLAQSTGGSRAIVVTLQASAVTAKPMSAALQVTATLRASVTIPVPPAPEGGSWDSLLGVLAAARADAAVDRERLMNPLDCPDHGWPLERIGGVLHCKFGGHVVD